jgi:hypothetical protein
MNFSIKKNSITTSTRLTIALKITSPFRIYIKPKKDARSVKTTPIPCKIFFIISKAFYNL